MRRSRSSKQLPSTTVRKSCSRNMAALLRRRKNRTRKPRPRSHHPNSMPHRKAVEQLLYHRPQPTSPIANYQLHSRAPPSNIHHNHTHKRHLHGHALHLLPPLKPTSPLMLSPPQLSTLRWMRGPAGMTASWMSCLGKMKPFLANGSHWFAANADW